MPKNKFQTSNPTLASGQASLDQLTSLDQPVKIPGVLSANQQKQGFWQIFMIMMGFTFFSPSMIAGGQLGLGLNLKDFVLAVCLGNLFLCLYTGLLGFIGQKTGMTLDGLAMKAFGARGSLLPSFIIGMTQMGWTGVGLAMFALPVASYLGLNPYLLVIIFGFLVTVTTLYGVKGLAVLGSVAVPAIFCLGSYSTFVSVQAVGGVSQLFASQPLQPLSLSAALSIVIGNFISGGTSTPNFARHGQKAWSTLVPTAFAFFFGNIMMFVFGAAGAGAFGKADIFDVLIMQGLAIPGILSLGFNIWTTNNNGLYTSALSFSNISKKSLKLSTILMGLAATCLSIFLYNHFINYLSLLGAMIPPIGGIIICDFFLDRAKYQDDQVSQTLAWEALVALLVGVLAGHFMQAGIASLNSLFAAVVTYLVLKQVGGNQDAN
ncbi:cytosine permease [Aerococcus urinaehominis]|uniref:cytosine permease n=1 Tax=Aerococcus urinaehominis TaxID=128944 RepID=UPI00088094E6|nr:cytosine permease [Aerococcus urinaehominis]SDL76440.1 cytosine permease [Aerococcus urinaehominis]